MFWHITNTTTYQWADTSLHLLSAVAFPDQGSCKLWRQQLWQKMFYKIVRPGSTAGSWRCASSGQPQIQTLGEFLFPYFFQPGKMINKLPMCHILRSFFSLAPLRPLFVFNSRYFSESVSIKLKLSRHSLYLNMWPQELKDWMLKRIHWATVARVLYLRSFRDVILTPAWAAAIVQWNRQRLPSCGPGLKFQAQHQCFFSIQTVEIRNSSFGLECEKR